MCCAIFVVDMLIGVGMVVVDVGGGVLVDVGIAYAVVVAVVVGNVIVVSVLLPRRMLLVLTVCAHVEPEC